MGLRPRHEGPPQYKTFACLHKTAGCCLVALCCLLPSEGSLAFGIFAEGRRRRIEVDVSLLAVTLALFGVLALPMAGRFCCICGRFARVPFAECNYCGDAPSYHHGRCCPWKPPREEAADDRPLEAPEGICQVCGSSSGLQWKNGFHCIPCHNQQQLLTSQTSTGTGQASSSEGPLIQSEELCVCQLCVPTKCKSWPVCRLCGSSSSLQLQDGFHCAALVPSVTKQL